jgi:hypothetical protein
MPAGSLGGLKSLRKLTESRQCSERRVRAKTRVALQATSIDRRQQGAGCRSI